MTATRDSSRTYWWWFGALLAGNLLLIWALPILPAQDLPQHLAYGRILADYDAPGLAFHEYYQLPEQPQSYFTAHYLLAAFSVLGSMTAAAKLLFSLYAVGVFFGFRALVRATWRGGDGVGPRFTALLATALVWNPVVAMGFLAFQLAFPLFLFAVAELISGRPGRRRFVATSAVLAAAISSVHIVAAGCLLAVALLYVVFEWTPRAALRALFVVGVIAAVNLAWMCLGGDSGIGVGELSPSTALKNAFGAEFLDKMLDAKWSSPTQQLNYVAWTVLGPYSWRGVFLVAAVALAAAIAIRRWRMDRDDTTPTWQRLRCMRGIAIGFAVLCLLAPWGIYKPTEVTFLNMRMFVYALPLALAMIDPAWFAPRRSQLVLAAACVFLLGHAGYRGFGFNREAGQLLALLDRVERDEVVMPLAFHNKSAHYGDQFRVTHFLPMYHTIRNGGICTQFWARYTSHLPIAYKKGRRPVQTPDWKPETFEPEHTHDADFVLYQRATLADAGWRRDQATAAHDKLAPVVTEVECRGLWCLYRVNRYSTPVAAVR